MDTPRQSLKACACCRSLKALTEYNRSTARKDGRHCYCRDCEREKSRSQYLKHKERKDAQNKRWYENNKEARTLSRSLWADQNRDRYSVIYRKYRVRHPERIAAKSMRRYAQKRNATPAWANEFFIGEIYDLAQLRSAATGYEWEVDHIVPLRHKRVCGLHVEHNLRVVPSAVNAHKHNSYWPGMPVDFDLSERTVPMT